MEEEPAGFGAYRARMLDALREHAAHKARAAAARAEVVARVRADREAHPQIVGGRRNPIAYDVKVALVGNLPYELAKDDRDAAGRDVLRWAAAAVVEALAVLLDNQPP